MIRDKDLLQAWEEGLNLSNVDKSLTLLSLFYPSSSIEELATLSIGERDARLLHIRSLFFGNVFNCVAHCTACGLKIEWDLPLESLQLQSFNSEGSPKILSTRFEEYTITFRLPNSLDVLGVISSKTNLSPSDLILQQCILETTPPSLSKEHLPEVVKTKIMEQMAQHDPQADINMEVSCPDCGHNWLMNFDIVQFLWSELNTWAYQMIQDVGLLAYHFGWSESDILSMSRFRRNLYLSMVSA